LKDQAAVRRTKKAKLNDLYFNSQVKDLIFYQNNEEQSGDVNSSVSLPRHRRQVSEPVIFEKRGSQNKVSFLGPDQIVEDQRSNKSGYNA